MLENIFRTLYTIVTSLAARTEDLWAWLSTTIPVPLIGDVSVLGLLSGSGVILLFTWWLLKGVFL